MSKSLFAGIMTSMTIVFFIALLLLSRFASLHVEHQMQDVILMSVLISSSCNVFCPNATNWTKVVIQYIMLVGYMSALSFYVKYYTHYYFPYVVRHHNVDGSLLALACVSCIFIILILRVIYINEPRKSQT